MSEDEAIKRLQEILDFKKNTIDKIEDPIEREIEENCYIEEMPFKAIETILDLYKQEKEKNKKIKKQAKMSAEEHERVFDKMEKMIDELIGDLQMEGCLKDMTDEEIYRYYEKRVLLTEQNTEGNHIPRID